MSIATILIALVLGFIAWKVLVGLVKFGNGSHEGLGNELPAKIPEPAPIIRKAVRRVFICHYGFLFIR